ncbi:MAG: hypothetical protein HFG41_05930 [Coprococcus sp.]|nr:hypothetical protein [Coprococcus sp.]
MKERTQKRVIRFGEAFVLVVIFVIIFVLASGRFPTGIAILLCAMVSAAYGVAALKIKWDDIYQNILAMFAKGMSAVIILLMVGLISASWLASGTIPALVIMGLKILTPSTFLVAAFIASAIVSIATGSSWTTCATVGVALMGVANGIGVPVGIAGGAIVSGCWIGDKWSPLSDTTNLGAAMTGEDVIDVWKKMLPTSGIGAVIAAVIFAVMGLRYAGSGMDKEKIRFLIDGISGQYKINLVLLLIPIVVVVVLAAKKMPVLPVLVLGIVLAFGIAVFYQGKDPGELLNALYNGYVTDTGVAEIDKLLTGGGMLDMMGIMLIIFCAFILAGTLESVGVMSALISKMGKITGNRGTLVLSSYISAVLCTYLGGTAYTGVVLNTGMFEQPYKDAGLDKLTMARSLLEGSGHTNALVPWCGSHVLIVSTLGITFKDFLPFYYSFWVSSILLIVYGFTGWFMGKKS